MAGHPLQTLEPGDSSGIMKPEITLCMHPARVCKVCRDLILPTAARLLESAPDGCRLQSLRPASPQLDRFPSGDSPGSVPVSGFSGGGGAGRHTVPPAGFGVAAAQARTAARLAPPFTPSRSRLFHAVMTDLRASLQPSSPHLSTCALRRSVGCGPS